MKKIKVVFEDGKEFIFILNEKKAPETVAIIWNSLPFESNVTQSRWSGREINFKIGELHELPVRENQSIYMSIGEICYWRDWRKDSSLPTNVMAIYYGAEMARSHSGEELVNIFGQLEYSQLEDIKDIGERIWLSGMEKVRVERVL